MAKSYDSISVLRAEDPTDLYRQTLLVQVMTDIVAALNRSHAAVRGLPGSGAPTDLRSQLLAAADRLERDYC
ncbi:hypothetical protein [Mycolicibacterium bacteremicum]|uniref:hypothetical protein n=1 Tax=Mycolicibacterium bacteremicum TaxID=564198 RepID=UPI000D6C4F1E|nr:hypothetical protein [Mycolicibacterium bacteremicum]MCV7435106.1 hypothetical protein [Mycolicibacterium bacteremicum]